MAQEDFRYKEAAGILETIEDQKADLSKEERKLVRTMIEKLHAWELFEIREKLYLQYIRELGNYTDYFKSENLSDEKIFYNARNLLPGGESEDHVEWLDIKYEGKIVGFLIMARSPLCHPSVDYFIYQTYVHPDYRKKGLMSSAIRSFMKNHPRAKYCIIISRNNKWALHFWQSFFHTLGYTTKPLSLLAGLSLLRHDDDLLVGYEPDPRYFKDNT